MYLKTNYVSKITIMANEISLKQRKTSKKSNEVSKLSEADLADSINSSIIAKREVVSDRSFKKRF